MVGQVHADDAAQLGQDDFHADLAVIGAADGQGCGAGFVMGVAGVRAVGVVMAVLLALAQGGGHFALYP